VRNVLVSIIVLLLVACSDDKEAERGNELTAKLEKAAATNVKDSSNSNKKKSDSHKSNSNDEKTNKVVFKKLSFNPKLSMLENIRAQGKLVVLIRNAPTTYYYQQDQLAGFEYELINAYAKSLGVEVKYIVLDTITEILQYLDQGKGHIAAAGLTLIQNRKLKYFTSPGYYKVQQQVVCRQGGKLPRKAKQLKSVNLVVIANSSYVDELTKLKQKHPGINWLESSEENTEDLLVKVWKKEIDCTIADSNIVAINRRYYPELVVTFNITKPQDLVWYYSSSATEMHDNISTWFAKSSQKQLLAWLDERYYGFINRYNYVNTKYFVDKIRSSLPRYKKLFKLAAKAFQLDWTLLAAQGYQESQWKPNAKSPTGVRGIMMLTRHTAKEVQIDNRLNPEQSIFGGAFYFSKIKKRLPVEIKGDDRTWIALAAYNVGLGHIYDARRLARRLKLDPNSWRALKTVLPLLHKKKYYRTLRYGYARGREPVRYVARIRDFHDLLLNWIKQSEADSLK